MKGRVVVALGGNAILRRGQTGTYPEQLSNVESACEQIAKIVERGYEVVLTHGNGPQVGNIVRQNEMSASEIPPLPLDACGAESQGLMGYMIQQCLANSLRRRGIQKPVVTVITQVMVNENDPAFTRPSKPIGEFLTEKEARVVSKKGDFQIREERGKGWRRVVPSPAPKLVIESGTIRVLVSEGCIPIACGGGGIPVCGREAQDLRGAEAVIDKDLTAQILANDIEADTLLILVDVEGVFARFGAAGQRLLREVSIAQAEEMLGRGEFAEGSMAPKIEASVRFLRLGGGLVRVGHLDRASEVLAGESGTSIHP